MTSKFNEKLKNLARNAGWRLGILDKLERHDFRLDQTSEIIRLRNKVHDMDIEISYLKSKINSNENARKNNKMLQQAWDQYQMLLKLTK